MMLRPAHVSLLLRRACSTSAAPSINVCIVGAGPAGFYTADALLAHNPNIRVDILDSSPSPYGLVRTGVAPDHPDVKLVTHKFATVASNPRCQFLGNVRVGPQGVPLSTLRQLYSAVVLAYGSSQDRLLGIEGEKLQGVHSAREFVGWYNGVPACRNFSADLQGEDAVIVGQGNVALDVARILLSPIDELAKTDMTSYAVEALRASKVRRVYLVGRRGPAHASFTTAELREIVNLPNVRVVCDPEDVVLSAAQQDKLKTMRPQRRMVELLLKSLEEHRKRPAAPRELYIKFLRAPHRFLPASANAAHVGGLETSVCRLEGPPLQEKAVATDRREVIPANIVFRSIGYKALPMDGAPFDKATGVIPNTLGRVQAEPALYVSGWIKRGPVGVIASTMADAKETAAAILSDVAGGLPRQAPPAGLEVGSAGLQSYLANKGVKAMSFQGWLKVDAAEVTRGQAANKLREKIVDEEEMLTLGSKGS